VATLSRRYRAQKAKEARETARVTVSGTINIAFSVDDSRTFNLTLTLPVQSGEFGPNMEFATT
jgi:hypothetical protein